MYSYIIVDDESLIRKGTIKKLETLCDKIVCIGEASNGVEGLDLIESLNPDVIITDMHMPTMGGNQFLPLIAERYPRKIIIVISGYKDFEYAKHAIAANAFNYILKPFSKEEIQKTMIDAIASLEAKRQTQEQIINMQEEKKYLAYDYDIQMLKSFILGYQNTVVQLTSARLQQLSSTHNLTLLTLYSTKPLDENYLNDFASANGYGDFVLFLSHLHQEHMGFLIIFSPARPLPLMQTLIKQISSAFIQLLSSENEVVSLGISAVKQDLMQLNEAYKETINALNQRTMNDKNQYYMYPTSETESFALEWIKLEEFLFRIEAAEFDRVPELVDNLFDYFLTIKGCTLSAVKNYSSHLLHQIKLILSNYMTVNIESDSGNIQNIFNSIFTYDELKTFLTMFFINTAKSIKGNNVYTIDNVVEKIMIYVQKNYSNNLNLDFIASLFYMNRSYLSHLFKEKTGEKFIDYITNIRIQKSKELLEHTDKKMYQIAKASGYENVKYFFRIFKKQTGMTPEEYRKRI